MSGTDGDAELFEGARGREEILDRLETAMAECDRKIRKGRMEDPERERARQGWHQTLAKLANAYRLLSRDADLDQMAERIEEIEERQERGKYR